MAEALYRRYRPRTFQEVVGQEHVTTTLINQIASQRIGHAYLFVGSRGCGKTTCARILAKDLNLAGFDGAAGRKDGIAEAISEGRHMDIIEFDAASHTGVDDIRDILGRVAFRPTELPYKVYVIDEVHMLSNSAFNALLKTLEEPPSHVVFILATTDPQKIPPTVVSRCQRFNFKRVPINLIVNRLRVICNAENIEADDAALQLIARQATGAVRDAISMLDQLASSSSQRITSSDVRESLGATDAATVKALVEALTAADVSAGLDAIQLAIDHGADARQVAKQTVDVLRAMTQLRVNREARMTLEFSDNERSEYRELAGKISSPLTLKAIRAFSGAINEMRSSADAQLALEMAFLDCAVGDSGPPAEPHALREPAARSAPDRPAEAHAAPAAAARPAGNAPAHAPAGHPASGASDAVRAQWRAIVNELKKANAPVVALLNTSRLQDVEGSVVHIRPNHDFVHERLNNPKTLASIADAVNTITGGNYSVQLIPPQPRAAVESEEDPVLSAARRLGGKVRE